MNRNIEKRLSGRHKKWISLIDDIKDKKVLDVGCSYGWFEDFAIRSSCKMIYAIEPDEKDFFEAKQEVPAANYVKGSVFQLPFDDQSFDVVGFFDVIEHIPRRTELKALKEINRVLKTEGVLYLSTPHRTFLSNALDPAWFLGHRHYSESELREFLQNSGYELEWVDYGGGIVCQLYMILFYFCKFFLRREMNLFKSWFDKKRENEYLKGNGFTTIFLKARKL